MINERDAIALVKKNKGGSIEGCYGPSRIAGYEVWEVWAHDGNEYVIRFVTNSDSTGSLYFSSFGELCAYVNMKYEAQNVDLIKISEQRHISMVQLYVAALVFMAAVAVLLYLTATGATPNMITFGILASLIASGSVMFYGAWKQMHI